MPCCIWSLINSRSLGENERERDAAIIAIFLSPRERSSHLRICMNRYASIEGRSRVDELLIESRFHWSLA